MIVSELYVYPIKSCQGIKLKQAEVKFQGFLGDREMMLVTAKGKFLTQRQFPNLARVQVKLEDERVSLSVQDNSLQSLTFIPTLAGREIEIEIWGESIIAIDQGDEVAAWFHRLLQLDSQKQCRLVKQSLQYQRLLQKPSTVIGKPVSFADNYPFMLTATASWRELNERIIEISRQPSQTIPMNRFRPNIVIETTEPFVEDNWSLIKIGTIEFAVIKPSSRCIITTIDQETGEKNQYKEPLRTLGTFRQFSEQGVFFGENMIPQNEGIIKVGDRLEVLQLRSHNSDRFPKISW
ncbi:MAG: MOSC domain-containing protein [Pleurocapsa sp.]